MSSMLDFRERTLLRRALYSKPVALLLAVFTALTFHSALGMYEKSREASLKDEKAQAELVKQKEREVGLKEDIARLSTDRGIEEEIRSRFMVAKDGEQIMIISTPKDEVVHTVTVPEDDKTNLQKVLGAIGFSGE